METIPEACREGIKACAATARIWLGVGFLLLFVVPVLFSPAEPAAQKDAETPQDRLVVRVIDGDTVDMAGGERIRLIGIDAPERGEDYYDEAATRLRELLQGKTVELRADTADRDEYGRLLRYVYLDGVFINELMVREGYARQFPFGDDRMHQDAIAAAEDAAKAEQLGIWAE